jgi:uncharacterized protein involved in outer membrane biogenesis
MKTLFKFSAYTFLGLCGLIALTVIILKLISDEQYKEWAAAAVESATGRELAIAGPFNLQFGTSVNLLAQDLSLSNAQWGSRDDMVNADRLFVELSLLPLLKGVLDLTVELDGPDVLLETNDKGDGNWIFSTSGDTAPQPQTTSAPGGTEDHFILPFKPYIRNFKIRNFLFAFNDPAANQPIEAHIETFRVFVDKTEGLPLVLNGVYQDAPVILEGTLGNINDWYANKQTPIVLKGKLNEADIKIEGTAGPLFPQPAARLDISLRATDISTFSQFAGMNLPELAGLNITATAVAADGRTAVENIIINLSDPQLTLDVTGEVTDLSNVAGISLKADVTTDQGTALSERLGALSSESIPDSLFIKAELAGDLDTLAMTDLDVSVKDKGVDIKLSGTIDNILKLEGAEVKLTANIETLHTIGGYIGLELPGVGPIDISTTVISPDNVTQLESLIINITDPALSAQVSATTGHITLEEQNKLEIDNIGFKATAESSQLQEFVNKLDLMLPVSLPSSLSLDMEGAGNLDKLGVDTLEIVVKDEGVAITLSATAENILDQSGISAMLTTDVASTANLSKFAGMEIPDLGSVVLKGLVSSADQTYTLDKLDLQLDGKDLQAKVKATIQDLLVLALVTEKPEKIGTAGIDMSLDANVSSISNLTKEITGLEAPDLGSLKLNGHVSSADEMLALDSFNLQLDGDDLRAQLKATIKNLLVLVNAFENPEEIGAAGIDLSLNADIASISEFAAHTTGIEIPELGRLQINGQANSVEQALELKLLSAVLKAEGLEANIDATIADVFALSGIDATVSAKINSLKTLGPITKTELPETGPWLLNGRASSEDLNKSLLLFNASLEGEGTKTVVDATIPDLKSPGNILAKLSLDAESLVPLEVFIDKDLPGDEPLKITANIVVSPGEYSLEKVMILLGQGKLLSNLVYTSPLDGETGRKKLTAQVSIQGTDITPFLATITPPSDPEAGAAVPEEVIDNNQKTEESTGDKKLFSNQPLAVGTLQDFDIELKLDAEDITIHEGVAIQGNMAVTLDQGLLTIDPFDFSGTGDSTAGGVIELDTRDTLARLDVLLDFNDFVLPKRGGKFNLDADVKSEGDSIAALMGNLDGIIIARLNDANIEKTFLTTHGAGLIRQVNPFGYKHTTLECAIVHFDITDGMVDFVDKLALQTTEVTWVGGGEINLKTEEFEMGMASKARKAISSLTDFGIASNVTIDGTLAEPSIGTDSKIGRRYAAYLTHVATAGLSFLAQKAYDNRQSNKDPCQRILAEQKEKN